MQKILLIGANGQLGKQLQPLLQPLGELTAVGRQELDLTNPDAITNLVATVEPQVIVNAAAYTMVDKAESDQATAIAVNGKAPGVLAESAKTCGATFLHVSTDYVFDGSQSTPYVETDLTNPLGVYGSSKLMGEEAIAHVGADYINIRTSWVYGAYGQVNFVKTMLRLAADRPEIRVVYDQVGSPTWTGDLARAIASIIPKINQDILGTYHYTNSGVTSWYDFAIAIFEEAEKLGFPLKIERVIPITSAEYPTPTKRPSYSVLNCGKINQVLGTHQPQWRVGLRQMLQELKAIS